MCGWEKQEKEEVKTYGWKKGKNNIKNKKSQLKNTTTIFSQ